MKESKRTAINVALVSMEKAKTFKSKVGACLYRLRGPFGYPLYFSGFNVETYIHKGYHAEEVALINALLSDVKPKEFEGIIIVYDFGKHNNDIYPACASCRQFLWEFTNPNLLVTVVDLKGNIMFEDTLKNLYPYPYPKEVSK